MSTCPVCKSEFKDVEKHILKLAKKDEEHKKFIENKVSSTKSTLNVTFKKGDIIDIKDKGRFEVVEDHGAKITIKKPNSNLILLTIKKETI